MHWFVVIHRHPMNVEYSDVPESQLMGLIRGHVEDPQVYGFQAVPVNPAERAQHTVAASPRYPLAA
ncbi:hypothetical protein ACQP2P_10795 [Dactylosporangium sp. CA-139114]|uniref:hypothetical protein n=1 Tax=Dactylosporangium sp. CA-139114 TaxID=3239931 RepID=UPI003D98FD39